MIVAVAATVASGSCAPDTGITRCEKTGLNCPPGWVCSADQDVCIRAGSCGNQIVNEGEVCDDGNNQSRDGCSSDCQSEETCGNNIIDVAVGEICDDGNRTDGDGCSAECRAEDCGDRVVNQSTREECDTGPGDSIGCDMDCTFRTCGDGYINKVAGEDCDLPGMMGDTETCDGDCTFPACGDGLTNPEFTPKPDGEPEECDAGGNTLRCNGGDNASGKGNCQRPACGDGYHNPEFKLTGAREPEGCDLGGDEDNCNGNGPGDVNAKCQPPSCGDAYVNTKFRPSEPDGPFEFCDAGEDKVDCNGNGPGNDAAKCQAPRCGDGYVNTEFKVLPNGKLEVCDEGEEDGGNTKDCNGHVDRIFDGIGHCQRPACGDGYHNPKFKPKPEDQPRAELEGCDTGEADTSLCNGTRNSDGKGNCQEPACGDEYYNDAVEECDPTAPQPDAPCVGIKTCQPSCICD